jgi:hypothetical protein
MFYCAIIIFYVGELILDVRLLDGNMGKHPPCFFGLHPTSLPIFGLHWRPPSLTNKLPARHTQEYVAPTYLIARQIIGVHSTTCFFTCPTHPYLL